MKVKKIPLRMCLGCREMKSKKDLVRVVKNADDEISLDTTGKKPGRGAYVCPYSECFLKARKTNMFERAFSAKISEDVYQQMEEELAKYE